MPAQLFWQLLGLAMHLASIEWLENISSSWICHASAGKYLRRYDLTDPLPKKKRPPSLRWLTMAACFPTIWQMFIACVSFVRCKLKNNYLYKTLRTTPCLIPHATNFVELELIPNATNYIVVIQHATNKIIVNPTCCEN